jgi:hypothetical protein
MGIQTQMDLQMAKIEALQKRKGQDWVWNWEKRMDFPMEIDLGVKTENQMARRISMANQKEKN